jgi:hypothetical protein
LEGHLGDGEHPAEEEPGEDVVVVGVLPEPHLDLPTMRRNEMSPDPSLALAEEEGRGI